MGSGVWCFRGLGLMGQAQGFRHLPFENGLKRSSTALGVWGFETTHRSLRHTILHTRHEICSFIRHRHMQRYSGALMGTPMV